MKELYIQNELLTREEVMELLKIGRSTFYKLIQEGALKGFNTDPQNHTRQNAKKELESVHIALKSAQKSMEMRNDTHSFSINSLDFIIFRESARSLKP